MADMVQTDAGQSGESGVLMVRALGERSKAARDSEVIILAYLSQMTAQQVLLERLSIGPCWKIRPAAVGGVKFEHALFCRKGELELPRLQGGVLAVISHAWSGTVEIETDQGAKKLDLYSALPKAVVIDTGNGVVRDFDSRQLLQFRLSFADATADPSLADQRETGEAREPIAPAAREPIAPASREPIAPVAREPIAPASREPIAPVAREPIVPAATPPTRALAVPAGPEVEDGVLDWARVQANGERSDLSRDTIVCVVEVEPIAGIFAELGRLDCDAAWTLESMRDAPPPHQTALVSRSGQFRLRATQSGSVAFLSGPEAGIVTIECFGVSRRIDLYGPALRVLRINFGHAQAVRPAPATRSLEGGAGWKRRDFYTAALARIDPAQPVGLYVPRWKGVASSTRNLFRQTLPFPQTAEGHPADVTPEDVKFLANTLLASGARHFVVSGSDTFWISAIRRVQLEDPRVRFDLLWHSNYLQMGEPHDWNLLKNWMRAIADGIVTRVGVVKQGLEQIFGRLGIDAVFIPNVVGSDPAEIRYNGAHDVAGIWLSGSSSYRKVPFASLLALKTLEGMRLIGAGFDDVSLAMVTDLRIPRGEIWREPLPQEALHRNIRRTGLTFYITLSECSPMLPLESMHLGVPCLVGACSHLFRSNPYLYKMLVVHNPLSPEAIARQASRARAEGQDIIDAFVGYAYLEQKQAAEGLKRLLS